jgi:hypothetical protein
MVRKFPMLYQSGYFEFLSEKAYQDQHYPESAIWRSCSESARARSRSGPSAWYMGADSSSDKYLVLAPTLSRLHHKSQNAYAISREQRSPPASPDLQAALNLMTPRPCSKTTTSVMVWSICTFNKVKTTHRSRSTRHCSP